MPEPCIKIHPPEINVQMEVTRDKISPEKNVNTTGTDKLKQQSPPFSFLVSHCLIKSSEESFY